MPTFDYTSFCNQFLYDPKNPLLFNNGFFVFFFTLFIVLYYTFRNKLIIRKYIFVAFSLYFFYKASGYFVSLVILSAVVDFFISNAIYKQKIKSRKTALLSLSIVFNLGMLIYFKYTNFFITISNNLFHTNFNLLNILLPVGISFYTFENISYTVDVYRGEFVPAKKFTDYLLFLSFFPKLVMGPIVRAHDFVPQINQPYSINEQQFAKGFYLIISGLIKKLIISDYITLNFVDYVFDDPSRFSGLENLFAVYGYAAVIYCDFSGYSDIAIGIAKWLGFNIPTNFLSPYQSKNITEFWRRWHISLSSWLKDYLYIPIGGNRKATFGSYFFISLFLVGVYVFFNFYLGASVLISASLCLLVLLVILLPTILKRQKTSVGADLNLLVTMLLGGFWHGANWNFLIWGCFHGIALSIHKSWALLTKSIFKENYKAFDYVAAFITFNFVCFCWIFFKSADLNIATQVITQILFDFKINLWNSFYENYKTVVIMMAIAYTLHMIPDDLADKVIDSVSNKIPLLAYVIVFMMFLALYSYFKSAEQVMPIYLQF